MTIFVEELRIGGDGPRVAVKDTIDVAGFSSRCGSRALARSTPAAANAVVVDRLLQAGCRIVGKTTLHELAFGVTGINAWAGTPINPGWPDLIPGGSSSGSAAAVAAGEADIALGTDTGGSIRIPAACCGVIGFKPTFGRIDRTGVAPAVTTLDCVGPFARRMSDIIFAITALDPSFVPNVSAEGRIGRLKLEADPEIDAAVDAALAASGLAVEPVDAPDLGVAFDAGLVVINRETFAAFGHLLASGLVGDDVATRLAAAGATGDEQVVQAEGVRIRFRARIDALLDRYDVLALPTLPVFPPTLIEAMTDRSAVALTRFVRPFNLSGHPALSLPIVTVSGLPAGLQLIARHGADSHLCALAARLERTITSTSSAGEVYHV